MGSGGGGDVCFTVSAGGLMGVKRGHGRLRLRSGGLTVGGVGGPASTDPTDCWFNNSSKHQSRMYPLQRTTLIKHGGAVSVIKER